MTRRRPPACRAGGLRLCAVRRGLACALCVLACVGCEGTGSHALTNDPLLGPGGGTPIPTAGPAAVGAAAVGPGARAGAASDLPRLPAPNPNLSAAALASGTEQTLDNAPKLGIPSGTTPKPADADLWRKASGPPTGAAFTAVPSADPRSISGQGATLQAPMPIPEPRAPTPPPVPDSGPAGRLSSAPEDQGVRWLEQQGAKTHGPERTATGEYRFICAIPQTPNSKTFRRYDVTVKGEPADAVRAVIDQIERERR